MLAADALAGVLSWEAEAALLTPTLAWGAFYNRGAYAKVVEMRGGQLSVPVWLSDVICTHVWARGGDGMGGMPLP